MFTQLIDTPVSPLSTTYVNTLCRPVNEPDYSLISLATVIIKPRVKTYMGIEGSYESFVVDMVNAISNHVDTCERKRYEMSKETLEQLPAFNYIVAALSDEQMDELKARLKKLTKLTELVNTEAFIQQQPGNVRILAFSNYESNTAYVVVRSSQMSFYHVILSLLPCFYPNIIEISSITEEEKQVLKSLNVKNHQAFIERVSAALQYMKTDMIRMELQGCFRQFRQNKLNRAKNDLEDIMIRIEETLSRYRTLVDQYDAAEITYEGLVVKTNKESEKEEGELIDFLSTCPRLHAVKYQNNALRYYVDTLLTNFDLQKWRNAIQRSNIYDNYTIRSDSPFREKDNRRLLLDNIFSNKPLLYIKVKGFMSLLLSSCDLNMSRGEVSLSNDEQICNCITNPHYKFHGCPGQNRGQIIEALRAGDIQTAIECSIAATGSVNIGETDLTFRPFIQEVLSSQKKVLQTIDGEDLTPDEALLWLNKRGAKLKDEEAKDEETMPF